MQRLIRIQVKYALCILPSGEKGFVIEKVIRCYLERLIGFISCSCYASEETIEQWQSRRLLTK